MRMKESDYNLNFIEAAQAMWRGKIVSSDCYPEINYKMNDGYMYASNGNSADDSEWFDCTLYYLEIIAKWKINETV